MPTIIRRWLYQAYTVQELERNILSFLGTSPMRETLIGSVDGPDVDGSQRSRDKLQRMGRDAGCHSSDEANHQCGRHEREQEVNSDTQPGPVPACFGSSGRATRGGDWWAHQRLRAGRAPVLQYALQCTRRAQATHPR
jgi:hypothetical protein